MPQMMPLNWISSMIFFICIFIMFNMINYYSYKISNILNKTNKNFNFKKLIWKW